MRLRNPFSYSTQIWILFTSTCILQSPIKPNQLSAVVFAGYLPFEHLSLSHLISQSFCRFSCHSTQPNSTPVSSSDAKPSEAGGREGRGAAQSAEKSAPFEFHSRLPARRMNCSAKENYANWKSTDADVRICHWQLATGTEETEVTGNWKRELQSDAIRACESLPEGWKTLRLADSEIEFTAKRESAMEFFFFFFWLFSLQIGSSICDE